MDCVVECYLFYDDENPIGCLDFLMKIPNLSRYFSKPLMEHLIAVNNYEKGILFIENYIDEFEDEEKMEEIRLKLSRMYVD